MNNLLKFKLGDVVEVRNGSTPNTSKGAYYDGEISWITPKDISDHPSKYTNKGSRSITVLGAKQISENALPVGTVMLSSRAPIGLLSIASQPLYTNQGFKNLISKNYKVLLPEYLYYYLTLQNDNLSNFGSGTTFKEISKSVIERFPIYLHAITCQKKICNILGLLDKKIELHRKMNADFESMTNTLYNYWFMQFDFPDQNGKPYKSAGGKMVRNEELKRDIPLGWEVFSLADLIQTSKNGDWGKERKFDKSLEVFCIRGADVNGLNGISSFNPPVRYIDSSNVNRLLTPDDLIIEISGGSPTQSTGRMAHVSQEVLNRLDNSAVCSNFCKAISLKDITLSYIIKQYWMSLYEANTFFNHEGKTSGIKNLLFDQLVKDVKIVLPDNHNLVEKYYDFALSFDSLKQSNILQSKKLEELRDWLLPMLMNGQVKVS